MWLLDESGTLAADMRLIVAAPEVEKTQGSIMQEKTQRKMW